MRPHAVLVDRRLARVLTIAQAVIIPVSGVLAYFLAGVVAAKSAALGAFICWLGSAYFALQAFRHSGARASKQILVNMYKGLIGKFVLIGMGIILAFRFAQPLSMVGVLAGFVLVQMMAWVVPLWLAKQDRTTPL